jgi:polyhydroxyalkanoate synthesis repressor PhaR
MSETRIIKKYPNRRLYDTAESKYITLEDIRGLVRDKVDFSVRDAKTDEDLTRSILLQVIMEQEEKGEPILTEQLLSQIIRFYGDALQGATSNFLQRSLALFVEQQQRFRQELEARVANNAVAAMTGLTQRNLALWKEVQGAFFGASRDVQHEVQKEKEKEKEGKGKQGESRTNGSRSRGGSSARSASKTQKRRSR